MADALNGFTAGPDMRHRDHCLVHGRWTRLRDVTRLCPECPRPKHEQAALFTAVETTPGQLCLENADGPLSRAADDERRSLGSPGEDLTR